MKAKVQRRLHECKRRIQHRLRKIHWTPQRQRMFPDQNIHYDLGEKTRGLHCGGLGALHRLVQQLGLADAVDEDLHLLKRHLPYFESDHVLSITYNLLADGSALQDIERLRNDENYLDALGAQRIPDPTTEGDFLRRFGAADIHTLMRVINDKRLQVWGRQPDAFFEHAILDVDGTLVGTSGECKAGMDLSYKGVWGYHPLLVSLANTREPLFVANRSASRPSHENAAEYLDRAFALCRRAGFRRISVRGDTDFSQTKELDRWDRDDVRFVFGIDAMPNLVALAEGLPAADWQALERPARYEVKTAPRRRPTNVKGQVVRAKGYDNIRLLGEQVAEFSYQPGACAQAYRVVVLRKQLSVEKGGHKVRDEVRYFFYITNERDWSRGEVVRFANGRCDQENLVQQLKNGVRALHAPVNTLEANWAYMVIASLAWSRKAWLALLQPAAEERQALLAMEFKKFLHELVLIPCQVVRSGRRLIYRLLQWKPWVECLFRSVDVIRRLRPT